MLVVGHLSIESPLVLAPMAGLTDSSFRRLIRSLGGCGLVCTEFISSEALDRSVEAEATKLAFQPEERPIAIQIYGSRPDAMADAAARAEDAGADICDLNMGCPARKIVKGTAGAALMGDLDLAREIIRAVRQRVSIPVTVKMRSGMRSFDGSDLVLGRICEDEGVDAVTLHPRTARQQYGGTANWSRITELSSALSIPVIGNGDVRSPEDGARMLEETGCAAVMIGRAALTEPWLIARTAAHLAGLPSGQPSFSERARLVRKHLELMSEDLEGSALLHKLKLHVRWFTHSLPGGRSLRQHLSRTDDPALLRARVEAFLDRLVEASSVEKSHVDRLHHLDV